MADIEVILEQTFGQTSHENAYTNTMQNEEDINRDARVGEDCENEDQEIGEYECIHDCAESIKPYMGQRFQTLDEGVRYYKEYAAFVGFDVRASTIKKNRYGDVEVKYLLCSREGYTVTKAQRSSTAGEGNEANINTRLRSEKHLKSVRKKAAEKKKIDGRKCNGCGQKPARHDFRNCHMNPKNQKKENENDKAYG
nr:protein FAR1-RELATED SEQUENCE 5-like [Ipomoea batatas]